MPNNACVCVRLKMLHAVRIVIYVRHTLGYSVASIDYDYSARHMDFLSVTGFLRLDGPNMAA